MILHYKPHPGLLHFISNITLVRYLLDAAAPRLTNQFPPQPDNCLFFSPYDSVCCQNYSKGSTEELPKSILVGPKLSRVDLTMGYNMLVIIVNFQPGGMHRFLHMPMHEMLEQPFDATILLGKEMKEIDELGWICIATIANVTALLVNYNWNGFGISEEPWTIIMIAARNNYSYWDSLQTMEPFYRISSDMGIYWNNN